jgi:hypothetical protein
MESSRRRLTLETMRDIFRETLDELLERYALGMLPASVCEALEEHLLICSDCQDSLMVTDEYLAPMKLAAASVRAEQPGRGDVRWVRREPQRVTCAVDKETRRAVA